MNATSPQPSPEDQALERELRGFKLVKPGSALKDRIRAAAADLGLETDGPAAPSNVVRFPDIPNWISAAAAVVALGFGIALWVQHPESGSDIGVTAANPDSAANSAGQPRVRVSPITRSDQVLIGRRNEGVVETEDGTPMWKVHYDVANWIEVIDPETGETRREITPEEHLYFVPVRHD